MGAFGKLRRRRRVPAVDVSLTKDEEQRSDESVKVSEKSAASRQSFKQLMLSCFGLNAGRRRASLHPASDSDSVDNSEDGEYIDGEAKIMSSTLSTCREFVSVTDWHHVHSVFLTRCSTFMLNGETCLKFSHDQPNVDTVSSSNDVDDDDNDDGDGDDDDGDDDDLNVSSCTVYELTPDGLRPWSGQRCNEATDADVQCDIADRSFAVLDDVVTTTTTATTTTGDIVSEKASANRWSLRLGCFGLCARRRTSCHPVCDLDSFDTYQQFEFNDDVDDATGDDQVEAVSATNVIVPRTVIIPTRPKRSHNSWSYLSFYGSSHCVSEQWKPQLPAIFEESECLCDDDGLVGRAGDCDESCGVDADAGADAGVSAAHNESECLKDDVPEDDDGLVGRDDDADDDDDDDDDDFDVSWCTVYELTPFGLRPWPSH